MLIQLAEQIDTMNADPEDDQNSMLKDMLSTLIEHLI